MAGLIDTIKNMIGGGMPVTYKDERPPAWPSAEDVAVAQKYDLSYGSPQAAYVQPRDAIGKVLPDRGIVERAPAKMPTYTNDESFLYDWNRVGKPENAPISSLSKGQQDQLAQAYSAIQKSALAALGFDPREFSMARPEQPFDLTAAGVTAKDSNMAATTGKYPSTLAHESMHRGVNILQRLGMLPPSAKDIKLGEQAEGATPKYTSFNYVPNPDETIVRALMARTYGPVEMGRGEEGDRLVQQGMKFAQGGHQGEYKKINNAILDDLEAAAAQAIAKRTPRGPR